MSQFHTYDVIACYVTVLNDARQKFDSAELKRVRIDNLLVVLLVVVLFILLTHGNTTLHTFWKYLLYHVRLLFVFEFIFTV